jgi:hypothetical protein
VLGDCVSGPACGGSEGGRGGQHACRPLRRWWVPRAGAAFSRLCKARGSRPRWARAAAQLYQVVLTTLCLFPMFLYLCGVWNLHSAFGFSGCLPRERCPPSRLPGPPLSLGLGRQWLILRWGPLLARLHSVGWYLAMGRRYRCGMHLGRWGASPGCISYYRRGRGLVRVPSCDLRLSPYCAW